MSRTQLTENFYLDEFQLSQTAERYSIDMHIEVGGEIHHNIKRLCTQVLQPVRDELGPVFISSGYRPLLLNKKIAGSRTSGHMYGLCADFTVAGKTPYEVAKWLHDNSDRLKRGGLVFDQVIHEFGRWVHAGINAQFEPARRQSLTAYKAAPRLPGKRPKTYYANGIHPIHELTN
ncbi:MAG: D-Ala-D-Ala carboxypeptidase family metallohydrolase [Pseudomonadales bacterium]